MADATLTLNMESVVHRALADTIERISDAYRIQITDVKISWLDTSSIQGSKFEIQRIELATFMDRADIEHKS
jgi:hypothetical protein